MLDKLTDENTFYDKKEEKMTDIVERLRKWEQVYKVDAHEDGALYNAAADEIERLREENKNLREECRELESSINRMLND